MKKCRSGVSAWLAVLLAGSLVLQAREQPVRLAIETFDAVWTMIRDTHFDPALNGVDWEAVRRELRPKAEIATTMDEVRAIVRTMLGRLGQSHFTLIPSERAHRVSASPKLSGGPGEPGIDLRIHDGAVTVVGVEPEGPAAKAGVRPGWLLRAVDGRGLSELLAELPDDLAARERNLYGWAAVVARLRGATGVVAVLEFQTPAGDVKLDVPYGEPTGRPVTMGNLPTLHAKFHHERRTYEGATAAIVRFNVWMTPIAQAFDAAMEDVRTTDGLIIDLRGNTGGLAAMIMGMSGHLLATPVSLGTMKMRGNKLEFTANPRTVGVNAQKVEPFAGPVAIVVDELSYSASEIFAGGLQAIGRARVFGQVTGGGTLPSSFDRLPNGDVLLHAVADFITPRGERLEGRGVTPDVPVVRTREDLLAGRDRPIEAALDWIAATHRASRKDLQ